MITHQPVNNHDDLLKVVDGLLAEAGLDRKDTGGKVTFAGMDPIRPTVMKVGCASAAVAAGNAIASAIIWKARAGESQVRKYYPGEKPYRMVYCEDPFGNIFELYSHSYELTYSAGAYRDVGLGVGIAKGCLLYTSPSPRD